jgi:hypothetical protein
VHEKGGDKKPSCGYEFGMEKEGHQEKQTGGQQVIENEQFDQFVDLAPLFLPTMPVL